MTTALQLTPEQRKKFAETVQKQVSLPALPLIDSPEYRKLLRQIVSAAEMLKSCYHARRVVLFGSMAHRAWFGPESDVDIAVEGLKGSDYLRAWREVEAIINDRRVDLIEIETASASLRSAIDRNGLEL